MIKLKSLIEIKEHLKKIEGKNGYSLQRSGGTGSGVKYELWGSGKADKSNNQETTIRDIEYKKNTFKGMDVYYVTNNGRIYGDNVKFGKSINKKLGHLMINGIAYMINVSDMEKILKKNFSLIKFIAIKKYKFTSDYEIEIDTNDILKLKK